MRWIRSGMLGLEEKLTLTKAECAILRKAAAIGDRAAAEFQPESDAWYDWKRLNEAALSCLDPEEQ